MSSNIVITSQSIEISKENNLFHSVNLILKISLAPMYASYPMEAVKNQLYELLFKFNDKIGGIPLSFSELKFPKGKEYGRIIGEQPFLHVDICTKIIAFIPTIGLFLRGKIITISDNHVSLLIYGMFNASISGIEMLRKYKFNYESITWESSDGDVAEGDYLEFKIGGFQYVSGVLNIDGVVNI